MNRYIIEFIGTFFWVFTISLTKNPLAVGFILTAMIYMGYSTSGSHYNPATTIAVWIQKKISGKESLFYILAQSIGAIVATLAFHFLYGRTRVFFLSPDITINSMKPLLIEALFTFLMIMVILYTAVSKSTSGNQYYGLAIGLTVTGISYTGANISGGAFNPAVGLMPILTESVLGICECHPLKYAWIYFVGPISGAIMAALLYRFVLKEEV